MSNKGNTKEANVRSSIWKEKIKKGIKVGRSYKKEMKQ
jgi:hypothetical protein